MNKLRVESNQKDHTEEQRRPQRSEGHLRHGLRIGDEHQPGTWLEIKYDIEYKQHLKYKCIFDFTYIIQGNVTFSQSSSINKYKDIYHKYIYIYI